MKALQQAKENYAEEKCIVDFEWTGEFVKDGHLCESVQVSLDAGEPFGVIMVKVDMYGNYPVRPPTMTILSKVHHPNVYKDGRVCMRLPFCYPSPDEPFASGFLRFHSLGYFLPNLFA